MRILFVTPYMPHPTQGGAAIRNWHLMHAAAEAGHVVHLITPDYFREGPNAPLQPLTVPAFRRTIVHRLRDVVWSREPDLAHRLGAHRLRSEITRRCRANRYDVIQIEGLEMWPSVATRDVPVIYDAHNTEAVLQHRMAVQAWRDRTLIRAFYSALQARKLRHYESNVMRHAMCTIAVSDSDAVALRKLEPAATVFTVPIGVDTAYYSREHAGAPVPATDVVFTGTLDYRSNEDAAEWFARYVWPHVRRARPDARCAFVGRNPSARLRAYHGHDGIAVTGSVPDDRPSMAAAAVFILPIRFGAGVRVKLLNAMSMACPIVATPAACEGIAVSDGQHVVIAAPEPERFAASVIALFNDPQRGVALGQAARTFVSEHYEWSVCTPRLLALYADLERSNG